MNRLRLAPVAALALALLATACGTTEDRSSGVAAADASGGPVTVVDSRGKEITLDAPARRVVALEWGEAEMLVTLGVMPVGVADVEGYRRWVSAAPLDPSVTDVGMRGEPSIETIVALEPDLVIMERGPGGGPVEQIEQYVKVLVTTGSDASDNLNRMREDFRMIATAVGRLDEAERILADFDAALEAGRKAIADAGATGAPFAMADAYRTGSDINVRMFGEGALVSQVAIALGLRNAWPGEGDEMWGLEVTDVEGVTRLRDQEELRFLYNASHGEDLIGEALPGNPIWDSLPFVAEGRVHRLTDGIWTFGGPASCRQYLDELVRIFGGAQ
ncbi:MAG: iron-siderophore ABC transporter substrate-binding protein [Micromonosporaceae bacterium]|jgi:ABC-type Fe3+-hydroxamate transport system substrate-binding protein